MTRPRIEDHPDFPFRPGYEARLQLRGAAFLDAPPPGSDEARLVSEFILLSHRFAFLERLIQGDILFELPVHSGVVGPQASVATEEDGERLAAEERELLDWAAGQASELPELLDEIGIKVFLLESPAEAEDVPPSADSQGSTSDIPRGGILPDLCGGFCFEGEVGPTLLVGATQDRPEAAFALAHEFGHLVADVNPYQPRFCRWDPVTLENRVDTPEEARADRFARALLVPEEGLYHALAQLGPKTGASNGTDPRWELLEILYEVPARLLARRLADLDLPPLGPLPGPPPPDARSAGESGSEISEFLSLPERFVNLALASYSQRVLDPANLARFLRTSEEEALRVVAWAQIPLVEAQDAD